MSRAPQLKPALGYGILTPLYDPLLKLVLRESKIKTALVDRANPEPKHRVLDLGCGTATLTLMFQERGRGSEAVGLDGDPAILKIAAGKARRVAGRLPLVCAFAERLPFPDCSFDRVVSCLMFHHLDQPTKRRAFQEVHRVLRPGGEFHLADFGRPRSPLSRLGFLLIQLLDGFETTADNLEGRIPALVGEAGLEPTSPSLHFTSLVGALELWSFGKPARRRPR